MGVVLNREAGGGGSEKWVANGRVVAIELQARGVMDEPPNPSRMVLMIMHPALKIHPLMHFCTRLCRW